MLDHLALDLTPIRHANGIDPQRHHAAAIDILRPDGLTTPHPSSLIPHPSMRCSGRLQRRNCGLDSCRSTEKRLQPAGHSEKACGLRHDLLADAAPGHPADLENDGG